jgi:hypothetical protein
MMMVMLLIRILCAIDVCSCLRVVSFFVVVIELAGRNLMVMKME